MNISSLIAQLQKRGVRFHEGLTANELASIEGKFKFKFPPDQRSLLGAALPVSDGFVNWRSASDKEIRTRLSRPNLVQPLSNLI